MTSKSVRTQRSFSEHMKTLLQNIDNAIYAGEIACGKIRGSVCHCHDLDCPFKSRMFPEPCSLYRCNVYLLRGVVGKHTGQDDIQIPDDETPEERKMKR